MFNISYSRVEGTNLYEVTLHAISQTIVLPHGVLVKKIEMDPRCIVGCKELPIHVIIDLGFHFSNNEKMAFFPTIETKMVL